MLLRDAVSTSHQQQDWLHCSQKGQDPLLRSFSASLRRPALTQPLTSDFWSPTYESYPGWSQKIVKKNLAWGLAHRKYSQISYEDVRVASVKSLLLAINSEWQLNHINTKSFTAGKRTSTLLNSSSYHRCAKWDLVTLWWVCAPGGEFSPSLTKFSYIEFKKDIIFADLDLKWVKSE